jgi:hypothetical protein
MYQELASKLYIAASGSEYLQPILMDGYNAVCVEVTVFTTTSNVTVMIQCSNDGSNWSDTASTTTGAGPMYKMCAHTVFGQIASKYVRVKLTTNATAAIVAVGINCANIGA